ncbi:MAG: class I SAM-dependent methyltransferase [Nitrospira sp.]|nr:class I SAM-dependent methyltransferase [Nitrospira sp.]
MIQERERLTLDLLRNQGITSLSQKKVLEIGCGTGFWLRQFINWGAQPQNITGVDLLPDRVSQAKELCPKGMQINTGRATKLHMEDAQFDLVLQSLVFSSMLDQAMKEQTATEMLRVLKIDGAILWYDFHYNNPSNPDVRGIKKKEIYHLFPGCHITLWKITLAPPLSRSLVPYSWLFCYLLGKLKIFNTHYLGIIRKGGNH